MKKFKSILTMVLILLISFFGCTKESSKINLLEVEQQSIFLSAPVIDSYSQVTIVDPLVTNIIDDLNSHEITTNSLNANEILKVKFKDYDNIEGFVANIIDDDPELQVDLFSVLNTSTGTRFTLVREILGFEDDLTGTITFRSLDSQLLISTKYANGIPISESNSLSNPINKEWNCTYEEFGEFYFAAKEECESDWLCDVACSFNPCTIAYLAAAIISCVG